MWKIVDYKEDIIHFRNGIFGGFLAFITGVCGSITANAEYPKEKERLVIAAIVGFFIALYIVIDIHVKLYKPLLNEIRRSHAAESRINHNQFQDEL